MSTATVCKTSHQGDRTSEIRLPDLSTKDLPYCLYLHQTTDD